MRQVPIYLMFFYEHLINAKRKTATLRLGDLRKKVKVGDRLILTFGSRYKPRHRVSVLVESVSYLRIYQLTKQMLRGESPDCKDPEAVPYVLSAVYKSLVTPLDYVTLITWKYD